MFNGKLHYLKEFYTFQKFGIPKVKYERISKSVLKKYLPSNPVSIDCGAHDGSDSVELLKVLGGHVHSFEPVPELYERLVNRAKKYKRISTYKIALADKTGKETFYVSEGHSDASSSLLAPKDHLIDHADTFFKRQIEVKTLTLDDWAKENNIPKVDLLWLDMQGFEMQMLAQSKVILPTVKVIHTEVSTKETYEGVVTYKHYRSYLESIGFKCVLEAIPDHWDMGNVLFVRK